MDIVIYLILIGLGVAASEQTRPYDYPDSAIYEETAPAEDLSMAEEPDILPEPETETETAQPTPGFVAVAPPVAPPAAAPADPGGLQAEDQTATGRMTTAGEVRPILTVTKGSWIAVREWDGQDLLYFTNLLAWRCGLHRIEYSVNDGPAEVLEAEPCYTEEGAPNALKVQDIQPYLTLPLGSVQTVRVTVLYDDLSTDSADYARPQIQIN
jgi:hypothetical protein